MSETLRAVELREAFDRAVASALEEDLGEGLERDADITTFPIVPTSLRGTARVYAKQDGVVCGLEALDATYDRLDNRVTITLVGKDGDEVHASDLVATLEGSVRSILVGERTALNIVGHLSGIATMVRTFARVAGGVELTDTRKTLPGLRSLQKYAVRIGGGANHRHALWDGILIKDNHIVAAGGVGEAVRRARASTAFPVQVECSSLAEVDDALEAGTAAVLLDNRTPEELGPLVSHIRAKRPHVLIEASGGVTLANLADIAASKVDRISVGAFTHSAPALDLSLRLEDVREET